MAKVAQNEYNPNFVSPPGDTIEGELEAREITPAELARQMGYPLNTINELIKGDIELTSDIATQLERVFSIPARFWLNRERRYRESLAKKQAATVAAGA
jgi:HTH-type transcriptional regulator / antitoxin HigA